MQVIGGKQGGMGMGVFSLAYEFDFRDNRWHFKQTSLGPMLEPPQDQGLGIWMNDKARALLLTCQDY